MARTRHRRSPSPRKPTLKKTKASNSKIQPVLRQTHNADELKKAGIGVASDLTNRQRNELAKLKEKNQKGYYKNGKLIVVPIPMEETSVKSGGAVPLPSSRK